jgi:hypothetical protein
MNSKDKLQYFYGEIEEKRSRIDKIKKRRNYSFIGALCSITFAIFISNISYFPYQSLLLRVAVLMFIILFYLCGYLNVKVGISALSEHEYIFYRLRNIQKFLSVEDPTKAEEQLKSLIQYVNDVKENYPDEPFTDTIFKNLTKFEKILRENLYPSLMHSNDEIAKKTGHYLKDVLKLVKEGNLNAICDIDVSGLVSEEIRLDELYEPTRVERIYGDIKELFSIPKVRYLVTFSIVTLIVLLLDFFIAKGSNWELVKDDFMMILFISAVIVGGLETYRKIERHT